MRSAAAPREAQSEPEPESVRVVGERVGMVETSDGVIVTLDAKHEMASDEPIRARAEARAGG